MQHAVDNRRLLTEYLLGKLNEEEQRERREQAERYFEDDELFDELLDVENELLDKYVRGQLTPEEHAAFASYLEKLPDGHDKVVLAKALMYRVTDAAAGKRQEEAAPEADSPAEAKLAPVSLWQSVVAFVQKPRFAFRHTLAASLGVMAIVISGLAIYTYQLHIRNKQLRAEFAQRATEAAAQQQKARELQQQSDARSAHVEQLQRDSKPEPQRVGEQAQKGSTRLKKPTPTLVSLVLTTTAARARTDSYTPDRLILARNTKFVSITAPIKSNEKYVGAVLQTTAGGQVQQPRGGQARTSRLGKAIGFQFAASQFTQTSYKLTLVLVAEDGLDLTRDYYFDVVKR